VLQVKVLRNINQFVVEVPKLLLKLMFKFRLACEDVLARKWIFAPLLEERVRKLTEKAVKDILFDEGSLLVRGHVGVRVLFD